MDNKENKKKQSDGKAFALCVVIGRFMRWLFSLLQKYNKGAKANDFPISKYGILGEKYRGG